METGDNKCRPGKPARLPKQYHFMVLLPTVHVHLTMTMSMLKCLSLDIHIFQMTLLFLLLRTLLEKYPCNISCSKYMSNHDKFVNLKGNSAFETADSIMGATNLIHMFARFVTLKVNCSIIARTSCSIISSLFMWWMRNFTHRMRSSIVAFK